MRSAFRAAVILLLLSVEIGQGMDPLRADESAPCLDKQWIGKHHYLTSLVLQASRQPPLDLYFLGDSITEFWPVAGKTVWHAEFGKLHVLNCGVSGDTTQNILYRVTHGEFDGISPKVVVLLGGINNLGLSPELRPDELARGLQRIAATLRAKSPGSKILLLSIFPSGDPTDRIRNRILETNLRLGTLADNVSIFYLDIYKAFLDADGNFPAAISPDGTHLDLKGYQIWADAMHPMLQKLLESSPD